MKKRIITQMDKDMAKSRRDYINSLSPEARKEYEENKKYDKQRREDIKKSNQAKKQIKLNLKRELAVLIFMKKTDVLNYHHGISESLKFEILKAIEQVKVKKQFQEYNPYIWNYQGEGRNYMPLCQFGRLFHSRDFNSIYDVPLDGSYKFYCSDSGQRGLGSFHNIGVKKVDEEIVVPKVNPGSMFASLIY